ncbi:TPA: hypothetical protein ACH9WG_004701 [Escherichia coli]
MKDNNTTATPEAWKMRFLANGTSGTWFYTDDIAVTDRTGLPRCIARH